MPDNKEEETKFVSFGVDLEGTSKEFAKDLARFRPGAGKSVLVVICFLWLFDFFVGFVEFRIAILEMNTKVSWCRAFTYVNSDDHPHSNACDCGVSREVGFPRLMCASVSAWGLSHD